MPSHRPRARENGRIAADPAVTRRTPKELFG